MFWYKIRWNLFRITKGIGCEERVKIAFKKWIIRTQCCKYSDISHHNYSILCKFQEVSATCIFLLSSLWMTCIFSKESVVTGGGLCPGGGSHFSPTKNNYNGPLRQNVYPTMMTNDILNGTVTLYVHFEYKMTMEPVIELMYCT